MVTLWSSRAATRKAYAFGFNGSAGIWPLHPRPSVGGWQTDTRAHRPQLPLQLAGAGAAYLDDVEALRRNTAATARLQTTAVSLGQGQHPTLRKLGRRVWAGPWPVTKRAFGLLHLSSYLVHPLLLGLLLVTLPLAAAGADPAAPLAFLSVASFGPPLLYAVAQRRLNPSRWLRNWAYLPLLMLLGAGLSLSNTLAVLQGLFGREGEFMRTPKFDAAQGAGAWQRSAYRLRLQPVVLGEVAFTLYALITAALVAASGKWGSVPFILLYALGFGLTAGIGVWQASQAWFANRRRKRSRMSEQGSPA